MDPTPLVSLERQQYVPPLEFLERDGLREQLRDRDRASAAELRREVQTRTVAMKANPGGRVPHRRALVAGFTIYVDTREKYAFRFARRDVAIEHVAVEAGDYAVRNGDRWLAVVERKSIEDLIGSLSSGTLVYQLAAMAELPIAAVVVEGRYPKLFELPRVKDGWLPDVLARLQIRYREIPIVFADSRKFAEEWTYRFLATALADLGSATESAS